jgi:hypothetical protein
VILVSVLVLGLCAMLSRWWATRSVQAINSVEERIIMPFAIGGLQVRLLQSNEMTRGIRGARTAPSIGAVVAQEALLIQFGRDPAWASLTRPARLYWYTQQQAWPSVMALLDTVLRDETSAAKSPAMRMAVLRTFRQLSQRAAAQGDQAAAGRWAGRALALARDTLDAPRYGASFSRRQATESVAHYRTAVRAVLTRFEVEQVGLLDPRRDGARRLLVAFAAQMREFPLEESDRQFLESLPGMETHPPSRPRPPWWKSFTR